MPPQKDQSTELLNELRNNIDVRVRIERSNIQNVKYVDFQNNLDKIKSGTNYVVFGRRGSGKTSLLLKLYGHYKTTHSIPIYIGCEMCKTYSYPNTLIFLLMKIVEEIKESFSPIEVFSKEKKEIEKIHAELKNLFEQPDVRTINEKKDDGNSASAALEGGLSSELRASIGAKKVQKTSLSYTDVIEKISLLERRLPYYQKVISNAITKRSRDFGFVLLDDYYFIKKNEQPLVIDYIHRLCKDTKLFFKVATVRHRSMLYQKDDSGIRGIQEGMDFQSIDLDYSLAEMKKTESFMNSILDDLESQTGSRRIHELLVSGDGGFNRLVWASGGVPRDFLIILKYCIDSIISGQSEKIGKREIDLAAHKYYLDKQDEFSAAYYSNGQAQSLLNNLMGWCLDYKERTGFLIRPSDNEKYPTFNDLIDLRLVHMAVKSTTSKSKSGEIFDGYILDVGSYSKRMNLRTPLKEIDILRNFDKKSESEFRSVAPILDWAELDKLDSLVKAKNDFKGKTEKLPVSPGQTRLQGQ